MNPYRIDGNRLEQEIGFRIGTPEENLLAQIYQERAVRGMDRLQQV